MDNAETSSPQAANNPNSLTITIPAHQVEDYDVEFPDKPPIDPNEHQLNQTYCIWNRIVDNSSKSANSAFSSNLSIVGCFNTVESFWRYYLHLNKRPSYENYDISFFRHGIKPMWEDKECENGGTVLFTCLNRAIMDRFFESLLLTFIGEQFFPIDVVVGIVYRFRKMNNVTSAQVWFRDFDQKTADLLCAAGKRLPGWHHTIRSRILRHKSKFTPQASENSPSHPSTCVTTNTSIDL